MAGKLKLPVGIDSFEKIRENGFYYVDKTKLIEQLLEQWGEVNLFTRPRRFGKSLNMSMLRSFFEIGADKSLFEDLYISQNKQLCEEYQGQFPVIFLSLKNVEGADSVSAKLQLARIIGKEAERFPYLANSAQLSENDKQIYHSLTTLKNGQYIMSDDVLTSSLQSLSQLLYKHHGKKTIILIDEYDVPLDKAFQHGYYKEMVAIIRGLMGQAFKSNEFLQFAVLTGCLRISKESIFTGLNNFNVLSIADTLFDEQFGFTETEVMNILKEYSLESHLEEIKEWYDGYHFGNVDIYCPWDVINHIIRLCDNPKIKPQSYWINSSGNNLVKRFIDKADKTTKDEIEKLIVGEAIEKKVRLELTYDEIDNSIDNMWSVLYTTGYLTSLETGEKDIYKLIIPNKEVREVFVFQIQEWFKNIVRREDEPVQQFCNALETGNVEIVQKQLIKIMSNMISILDTKAPDVQKENFYHGLLLGLLRNEKNWLIRSNVESGDGFCDIVIELDDPDSGIIIEVKYAADFKQLDKACETAMRQIKDRRYDESLRNEGRDNILAYGIAFCKKRCRVVFEKL